MKQLLFCRRTFIALISLGALLLIGLIGHFDVSMAIATVTGLLSASNATEGALKSKYENQPKD